ncbi:MAG TPA: DUF4395 domain-containing protein [Ornithinibacter sp.]|nr:DUF4395 domain-containing protein [Ornithinibacter sp.]
MASVRDAFGFPAVVNEKAARVVAGGVVLVTATALLTGWLWLSAVLAVGFALRVAAGPRFSPLGQLAVKVVAPRLGAARPVPGPPKRFAQSVGLVFTVAASGFLVAGLPGVTVGLLAVLLVFATLESVAGFCAGCWVFAQLMRLGLIPEETCAACADISLRPRETAAA